MRQTQVRFPAAPNLLSQIRGLIRPLHRGLIDHLIRPNKTLNRPPNFKRAEIMLWHAGIPNLSVSELWKDDTLSSDLDV